MMKIFPETIKKSISSIAWASVFALLILFGAASIFAQPLGGVVPAEKEAAPEEPAQSPSPPDPLGRETPRSFVGGLIEAMGDGDYERVARFLDLSEIPASRREALGPELARDLKRLLERGGWVAANWQLSSEPTGHYDDGLPPDEERFATIRTSQGVVGLTAKRGEGPDGRPIWRVSSETLRQVPDLLRRTEPGLIDRLLPDISSGGPRLFGVPLGQWGIILLLATVAYLIAWGFTSLGVFVLRRLWQRARSDRAVRLLDAAALPLRIYLAVWVFAAGGILLGVSVIARQQMGSLVELVAWAAFGGFLWRIVDALGEIGMERLSRRSQLGALSAVRFFRRSAKFLIGAVAVVAVLGSLGFDVTAGLAALGIGGLAIALGAQKTVENLVGSLTLIADQPVRIGDFCRFGETLGTVEDIGMRSTRIRTLGRTVVTVPNGDFSSLQIENYSLRDLFWFHPVLTLRYETTPDQIRYLLVELRSLLYAHPRVDPDPARVRFLGLGADTLNVEIFAYVHAEDYSDFLEVQEDLTLRVMETVAESGASFAFPSRTLYMARDQRPPEEKRREAEARVRRWSEEGELQLPRFEPERIAELRGSLSYPPKGSTAVGVPGGKDLRTPPPAQEPKPRSSRSFWGWKKRRDDP